MSKYYSSKETQCRCGCGKNNFDTNFLERLNLARELAGVPFIVNSAVRCSKHNKASGGSPTSSHLKGLAMDIKAVDSATRFKIVAALLSVGINRLGLDKGFVHCDVDPSKPANMIWTYS